MPDPSQLVGGNPTPVRWLAWLRLCRIGNVFTAFADVMMGYAAVSGRWTFTELQRHGAELAGLLVASGAIYTAGMVWNDWFDQERDRVERPERPIPSGAISPQSAGRLGVVLLLVGNGAALVACRPLAGNSTWLPLAISSILTILVLTYDGWLKATVVGPVAMGACRTVNVLLGMSAAIGRVANWSAGHWAIAGGIGVYVAGITVVARSEVAGGKRGGPAGGLAIMMLGLGLLGCFHRWLPESIRERIPQEWAWWGLLALIAFPILRRGIDVLLEPSPDRVRLLVGLSILTLIVLDASIALFLNGRLAGLAILALLVPAVVITRRIPPT